MTAFINQTGLARVQTTAMPTNTDRLQSLNQTTVEQLQYLACV